MESYPLISVIIPVYNVADYLPRCVETVLSQSYTNLEIILVDDGATDNSGSLCDEYAEKDSRIRVIHKKNGGLSSARNAGLDVCKGDYITFIDSDDWITSDYVDTLFNLLVTNNADMSVASFQVAFSQEDKIESKGINEIILGTKDAISYLLYQKVSTCAYAKLFKSDILSDIRFPEGRLYEDVVPMYLCFKKSEKIAITNKKIYAYFRRPGSIVTEKFSIRKYDYAKSCRELLALVETDYPELIKGAKSRLAWADIHIIVHMDDRKNYSEMYNELYAEVKKYRRLCLFDKHNRVKVKLALALSYGGYNILRFVFNIINR